ASLVTSFEEA
nr:RecName: Full=Beta-agarase AgaA34 [Agarivorans albus]